MQYDISITDNIACITIEGNVNSLDLMFMLQSKEYKDVINRYAKILVDYTDICGISLTAEDAVAIMMLGKIDFENLGEITIAVAVHENERKVMEKFTNSIFGGSQTAIEVTDSRSSALNILRST